MNPSRFLLSPTEHAISAILPISHPHIQFSNSSLCEANGADIIVKSTKGLVGYQRKTLADLKASLIDGRLFKELAQLRSSSIIAYPFIIIEHDSRQVTTTGSFLDVDLSIRTFQSLLTKFQLLSIYYLQSSSLKSTIDSIVNSSTYISSSHSTELKRPSPPKDSWGKSTSTDYLSYILQSFPGIGPKIADSIVEYFNNTLPLMWTVDKRELSRVPGIGKVTAERLYNFFNVTLDIDTSPA